ncbi:Matrix metalloproteinase-14 [Armadillidium vulgare]|nr:Matrix metalloproteinase-14 [Armadillidium vulgare]
MTMALKKGIQNLYLKEFYGLPSYLDAAFTWTNGKTYFFKGSEYWRFTGHTMDDDYPKDISTGFSGIPNNIDAAFVWSGNGKIYFFKGTEYYKFDPTQRPPVSSKYPKDLSMWEGLPYYIDDAFQYSNGYTYFFKNGKYWRFNDRTFKTDSADQPFPRQVGPWWFGCPEKGSHSASPEEEPTVPETRGNNPSDVSDDDAFNTDDYDDYDDENSVYPRVGNAARRDYSYDVRYGNQNAGNPSSPLMTLPWLVIPIVFKYICI